MPQPNSANYVSRPLTSFFLRTLQDADGFVAGRACPTQPVDKQFNKYYIVPSGSFNRDEMALRAPDSEAPRAEWTLSQDAYSCDRWALKKAIADEDAANMAGESVNLETGTTDFLATQGNIRRERLFASKFLGTSIWTGLETGVSSGPTGSQFLQWNDSLSTPIKDMKRIRRAFRTRNGVRANRFLCTADVWDTLEDHPDIIARINGGANVQNPALATRRLVAEALGVDEILVTEAIYNTAKQGQTDTNALVATKRALLYRVEPMAGPAVANAMTCFAWRGLRQELGDGGAAIYRMPYDIKRRSYEIEAEMCIDFKVTAADLGTYLTTVIA